jgi:hypothetical protein
MTRVSGSLSGRFGAANLAGSTNRSDRQLPDEREVRVLNPQVPVAERKLSGNPSREQALLPATRMGLSPPIVRYRTD